MRQFGGRFEQGFSGFFGFLLREERDTQIESGQRVVWLRLQRSLEPLLRLRKTLLPHVGHTDAVEARCFPGVCRRCGRRPPLLRESCRQR